ncbi:MAG: hypothetical protein HYV17_03770 [Xanthomonadales bacterium]|nr:hypothetical protein [Xanthomonadales bacterium]
MADHYGTVGGGYNNQAGGGVGSVSELTHATVGGGAANYAFMRGSTVSGGQSNRAAAIFASVGGGAFNRAAGLASTVGGGYSNVLSGSYATIPGGTWNCAGADYSFAAGRRAKVRPSLDPNDGDSCDRLPNYPGGDGDLGTFVWADSQNADFVSTGSNQFLVRAQGGVGLGTNAPQNQLHVAEDVNDWAAAFNHVAQIQNTSTGSSPDVLALKIGTLGNPGGSVNFITFIRGDDTSLGAIEGNGLGGVTFAGPGNDYAEWLPKVDKAEPIAPGQVVAWTAQGISRNMAGALRAMVVSSEPIVAGNAPMSGDRSGHAPVAFVGQAPVDVIGPVAAGDWIIASGRDDGTGIAVPGAKLGAGQHALIVGRALESSTAPERKPIRTLIGLGQEALLGQLAEDNAVLRAELDSLRARLDALSQRPDGSAP